MSNVIYVIWCYTYPIIVRFPQIRDLLHSKTLDQSRILLGISGIFQGEIVGNVHFAKGKNGDGQ